MRREAGVRDAAGLYCTSAHMGLPAAAVNVMITLTTAANHICSWEYGMLFLKGFFSLFRLRNHPQMMQHTMCTCSVLLIGHFGINFNSGYRQNVTKLCSATMQRCPPMIKQKNILQESL